MKWSDGGSTWWQRMRCKLLGHDPQKSSHPRVAFECGRCFDYVAQRDLPK